MADASLPPPSSTPTTAEGQGTTGPSRRNRRPPPSSSSAPPASSSSEARVSQTGGGGAGGDKRNRNRNRRAGGGPSAGERDVVVEGASQGGRRAGGSGSSIRAPPPHQHQHGPNDAPQSHPHPHPASTSTPAAGGGLSAPRPGGQSRRAGFAGGQLSSSNSNAPSASSSVNGDRDQQQQQPRQQQRRPQQPKKDSRAGGGRNEGGGGRGGEPAPPKPHDDEDLATRLSWAVGNPPFLDCSICFNAIFPTQPIWSCTPAPPSAFDSLAGQVDGIKNGEVKTSGEGNCCWGIFHLKCINDWASRSVKDLQGVPGREGEPEWRCPGCQTKRVQVPKKYTCFCNRQTDPKPSRLATPHSCGTGCSRSRWTTNCAHPCPLECHPGPCPPCSVSMLLPCGSHSTPILTRCSHRIANAPPSCGQTCARALSCNNPEHRCKEPCHEGPCEPCPVKETLTCYCGEETREGRCGEGREREVVCFAPTSSTSTGEETKKKEWIGRFGCERTCARKWDCGVHACEEKCHPHPPTSPSSPQTCPLSPSLIKTCPCGANLLATLPNTPPRRTCEDPIPTCQRRCGKEQEGGCGHGCESRCHVGPCPPCSVKITLPCRCGESKVTRSCYVRRKEEAEGLSEIRCERVCRALRSCSKHQCGRTCCPLAYKGVKSKGKKRAGDLEDEDEGGWHTCSLVCGKPLSCGNHQCPALDHKGPCPPCLEASYDELICHCRRTVVYPPIPCGRQLTCTYPCSRPAPRCGHPKAPHACHEGESCPPCIFLTAKTCGCGKSLVKNVRCSQDKVSCGQICGELLGCGWHRCEKSCHAPGEHEICSKPCGKPRKLCGHGCQVACHSPSACDESISCPAIVFQSCTCGRIQVQASCGASTSSPTSRSRVVLKCVDECQRALRNERLALALGISKNRTDKTSVEWPAEVIALAGTMGLVVVAQLEKALNDFVTGSRPTQVLPHSPLPRREFTQKLAEVYRLQTDMVDQDPVRSVRLQRRVDSRIPHPLLTAVLAQETAKRQAENKKPSLLTTSLSTSVRPPSSIIPPPPTSANLPVKPKPNPWGASPLPSSNASSPSGSRPGSPYVPPGMRKPAVTTARETRDLSPVAKSFVPAPAPAPAPPGLERAEEGGSELRAETPAFIPPHLEARDDTWELSDEEGA